MRAFPSQSRHVPPRQAAPARRGQALVEFALVAFALYLIVAAMLTFGRAIFVAQALQQTADVMSHELARTPLPPASTLDAALATPEVQASLFDENDLDLNITDWSTAAPGSALGNETLDQYLSQPTQARAAVPLVNRLLAPLMIIDQRADGVHLWYPGAYPQADGHWYVNVLHGTGGGFLPYRVIEPLANTTAGTTDLFPLTLDTNNAVSGGMAAVRLNYAFQSAALSAVSYTTAGGAAPVGIPVGQTGVENHYITAPTGETFDPGTTRGGLYGGANGLGQQIVAGMIARPFQRLISGQAVYRREVFSQ